MVMIHVVVMITTAVYLVTVSRLLYLPPLYVYMYTGYSICAQNNYVMINLQWYLLFVVDHVTNHVYLNPHSTACTSKYAGHVASGNKTVMESRPVDPDRIQGSHRPIYVKALVRWATGKRSTNRLPKLSLITSTYILREVLWYGLGRPAITAGNYLKNR